MASTTEKSTADKTAKAKKNLVDDEEFEEFPVQEWAEREEGEEEGSVWEDNWDEETTESPFAKQLKLELATHGHAV